MSQSTLPSSTHLLGAAFVDASSGLTFEVHHPKARPDVWEAYLDGAEGAYDQHGVGNAFHRHEIEDAHGVSLFFVGRRPDGTVAAGIRCHGPLAGVEESESLVEMASSPEIGLLTDRIRGFLPHGVVEQKGAWSLVKGVGPRAMFTTFNRCNLYAMEWLRCEFAICTVREQLRGTILANGGRQVGTASVPFPSEKHRTILMAYRRCRTSAAAKPAQAFAERTEIAQLSRTRRPGVEPPLPHLEDETWRPIVLDFASRTDRAVVERLASGNVQILDRLRGQCEELRALRPAVEPSIIDEPPQAVYYPWRRALVKLVGPRAFDLLRLDRNRLKITTAEQRRLRQLRIGVVGLSVGHAIAHLLAMEGLCGELRLADFDDIALTNLNRIPASLLDVGVNKAVTAARRIAEIDPYLPVAIWPEGITHENIDSFLEGLDLLIEECDSLDIKVLVRERARARRIPVLMETSDRGLLDVERFDLEPDRPLFHGLLPNVSTESIAGLSVRDKVPYVLQILGADQVSTRAAASLAEVGRSISTWPQLGGDVTLGAATTAAAVLHLVRDGELPSGRLRVDVDQMLDALSAPALPATPALNGSAPAAAKERRPEDPKRLIAYAASRAPSGGNVQPWRFELSSDAFSVYLDPAKSVSMDVAYRGSYVAIGASLFNARVAAAARGLLGPLELFPDARFDGPVGVLHFGDGRDEALAALLEPVLARATNRRKGTPQPIEPSVVALLREAAAAEKGGLHVIDQRADLDAAAELLAESDRMRFLTPHVHRELIHELRWPGRDPLESGIDVRTLELDGADLAALSLAGRADVMGQLSEWDAGASLGDNTRAAVHSSSALVAVTATGGAPADFVQCGAAVLRTWVTAELHGLAVHPVSPLFIYAHGEANFEALVGADRAGSLAALAQRFLKLLGVGDSEQLGLVLRLSHAPPPSVRSERLPLETVLSAGEPRGHRHGFLGRTLGSRR